jgi:hypothetical protein
MWASSRSMRGGLKRFEILADRGNSIVVGILNLLAQMIGANNGRRANRNTLAKPYARASPTWMMPPKDQP